MSKLIAHVVDRRALGQQDRCEGMAKRVGAKSSDLCIAADPVERIDCIIPIDVSPGPIGKQHLGFLGNWFAVPKRLFAPPCKIRAQVITVPLKKLKKFRGDIHNLGMPCFGVVSSDVSGGNS